MQTDTTCVDAVSNYLCYATLMYLYLYLKLEILQSILDVQVTGVILDVLLDIQVLQETTQPVIGKASCNTR